MVLEDHHLDGDVLLHGCDDFGRIHQVRAVADQCPHRPPGRREGDSDGCGDLVAHAGVAVFDVVLVARAGPPQLVEVAGERARRIDQDVVPGDQRVEYAEDLGLGGARVVGRGRVGGVHPRLPRRLQPRTLGLVRRRYLVPLQRLVQGGKARAGVPDQLSAAHLERVGGADVQVDEADVRVLEEGGGGGREVGPAGADAEHHVGGAGQFVGGGRPGVADAADVAGVVVEQRALARLGARDRDAGVLGERAEHVLGQGVPHPAAGDDQRPPGLPQLPHCARQFIGVDGRGPHLPDPLPEELLRPVVRLRLDVLRQRERDGAGVRGVGQDAHRVQGGRDQRLGAGDAVEVAGDRAQAVVDRHVARVRDFELLQDRVGGAAGEGVAGQEQHREVVDGGQGRARDQVGGAGADGGGHGVRREPAGLAGVADGGVHHGLLVAALVEGHRVRTGFEERLPDPGDVAVPEDAPSGGDQAVVDSVAGGVLAGQEGDQRLCGGEAARRTGHWYPSTWSGWKEIFHSRSCPGPAITFR